MSTTPPIIAVEHGKGGVFKTTVAVALAEAVAEAGGNVLLADTDTQGSAYRWMQLAEAAGRPLRSTVVGLATRDLPVRLPLMIAGHNFVVIDGPPTKDDVIEAGIRAADLVLMPVPPKRADMDRVPSLLKIAANHGKTVIAVQTATRPDTRQAEAAREALADAGIQVAKATIPYSVPVSEMYGGRPKGKLAAFGRDLADEVLAHLNHRG